MSSSSSSRPRAPKPRARRDSNHIPRPPNAFILFRSAFIRSQQIPDRVEGNHSNLSKIIGHYWKALSPQERAEWEAKAVEAQEEHRQKYPDWRFRPGPYAISKPKIKEAGPKRSAANTPKEPLDDNEASSTSPVERKEAPETRSRAKGKGKEKDSGGATRSVPEVRVRRDSRCEKIASLIVEGKTGAELASAVEEWEGATPLNTPSHLPLHSPSNLGKSPGHASSHSASNSPHQTPPATNASTKPKPPIKGISDVPLTQMFVSDRPPKPSMPSIAESSSISSFEPPPPLPTASSSSSTSGAYSRQPASWSQDDSDESPTSPFQARSSPGSDGPYWWPPSDSPSLPTSNPSFVDKSLSSLRLDRQATADLGYESTSIVDGWNRGFEKFGPFDDLPPDGSEAANWTTNSTSGRHGLLSMMHDPCMDEDPSQASLSSTEGLSGQAVATLPHHHHHHQQPSDGYTGLPPLPLASLLPPPSKDLSQSHGSSSGGSMHSTPTLGSSPFFDHQHQQHPFQAHLHQQQHHQHQDPTSSSTSSSPHSLLPTSYSYSTLTGWAGYEYDYDPTSPSLPLSSTPSASASTAKMDMGMSSSNGGGFSQHTRSMSDSGFSSGGGSVGGGGGGGNHSAFGWGTGNLDPSQAWPELHGGHSLGLARAPSDWEDEGGSGMRFGGTHRGP